MEALAKVFDMFVLLVLLFIFPVNWAMNDAERVSDCSIKGMVREFLDSVEQYGEIDERSIGKLESELCALMKHYVIEYEVKRGISEKESLGGEIMNYDSSISSDIVLTTVEKRGAFRLGKNDVLTVKVYDKDSAIYYGVRLIS